VKLHGLCVLVALAAGCSAAAGEADDRQEFVHELEVTEPDEHGDPAPVSEPPVGLVAPAAVQKQTPLAWQTAPPVDKPTPDPWSGEGCGTPPDESTTECGAGQQGAPPPAQAATLDP
jgi:hypothetical protein